MKVFLTGATGFIGQSLVEALQGRGWLVTALVRNRASDEARTLQKKGVALTQGDVTDKESMRAVMEGSGIVIHNAAWYEVGVGKGEAERRMEAINVDGARNTLSLAYELGTPKIVHVSSIVAHGPTAGERWDESATRRDPPRSAYERTKYEAHVIAQELAEQGAPISIAMPGAVVGPGDHANLGVLQRLYVRNLAPPLTVGNGNRSYVQVDDCAEGIALVAEKGGVGESYLLCNQTMTYRELYDLWATTPGGMKPWATMPPWMSKISGAAFERVQRALGSPNLLSVEAATMAEYTYDYSGDKARRELGWQPGDIVEQWLATLEEERRRAGKVRDATSPGSAAA